MQAALKEATTDGVEQHFLFESLYPRTASWSSDFWSNHLGSVEKHKYNIFTKGLGCTVSMFNHSSDPNAQVGFYKFGRRPYGQMFAVVFLAELATIGSEIYITYYCDGGTTHPYCSKEHIPKTYRPPQILLSLSEKMIAAYMETYTFAGISIRQHLSELGFLFAEDGRHVVFDEFRVLARHKQMTVMDLVEIEALNWIVKNGFSPVDYMALLGSCMTPTPVLLANGVGVTLPAKK